MKTGLAALLIGGLAFAQQAPLTPSAASAGGPGRKVLMAKSQDEFEAYQRVAQQPNLKTADANAQDFAVRFPESELRAALFQTLMLKHQSANNADAVLADAERVLLIDPQNVVALVAAANALAERSLPSTQQGQQRLDRALRFAERAAELLGSPVPPAEETSDLRGALLSLANAAAGNVYLLRQDYASAEKHLAAAAQSDRTPKALTLYRLAIAQRLQKKYDEALVNINKASAAADEAHNLMMIERVKREKSAIVKASAKP